MKMISGSFFIYFISTVLIFYTHPKIANCQTETIRYCGSALSDFITQMCDRLENFPNKRAESFYSDEDQNEFDDYLMTDRFRPNNYGSVDGNVDKVKDNANLKWKRNQYSSSSREMRRLALHPRRRNGNVVEECCHKGCKAEELVSFCDLTP